MRYVEFKALLLCCKYPPPVVSLKHFASFYAEYVNGKFISLTIFYRDAH